MQIAICDDQKVHCQITSKIIQNYFKKVQIPLEIDMFLSGQHFINTNKKYDIVFMDIELKKENGMKIAKIYKTQFDTKLIFLTSHEEEMPNGYKIKAFRFLTKPINNENIYEALDAAIQEINSGRKFSVLSKNSKIIINDTDIVYVEAGNRSVGIRTEQNFYKLNQSISELYIKLNPLFFYMPHRSYIVNMNFISEIIKNEIILNNGEKIKISRLKRQEFHKKFNDFLYIKTING